MKKTFNLTLLFLMLTLTTISCCKDDDFIDEPEQPEHPNLHYLDGIWLFQEYLYDGEIHPNNNTSDDMKELFNDFNFDVDEMKVRERNIKFDDWDLLCNFSYINDSIKIWLPNNDRPRYVFVVEKITTNHLKIKITHAFLGNYPYMGGILKYNKQQ